MNREEIKSELLDIKDRMLKLENKLDEDTDMEKFKTFKPKENELYFYIDIDGRVEHERYERDSYNAEFCKQNRVFKTEKIAFKYRDFMSMLKEKSKPFDVINFNHFLFYNHEKEKVDYGTDTQKHHKELYFHKNVILWMIKDYPNELKYWYLDIPYEVSEVKEAYWIISKLPYIKRQIELYGNDNSYNKIKKTLHPYHNRKNILDGYRGELKRSLKRLKKLGVEVDE